MKWYSVVHIASNYSIKQYLLVKVTYTVVTDNISLVCTIESSIDRIK